jgi:hypothetical protein
MGGQPREVVPDQPHPAGLARQRLLGRRQRLRVAVESDQRAVRRAPLEDLQAVPAAAQRGVDVGPARANAQQLDRPM